MTLSILVLLKQIQFFLFMITCSSPIREGCRLEGFYARRYILVSVLSAGLYDNRPWICKSCHLDVSRLVAVICSFYDQIESSVLA